MSFDRNEMEIINSVKELKDRISALKSEGKTIGLVPTMGALHEGHASLVRRSVGENDVTVVSDFVNPTQFNDKNDLKNYPRTMEADCALLEPMMKVEIVVPEDYLGDVIGDVNSRRGRIEGMDEVGNGRLVKSYVPLAEMFGYSTDLRSKTQGRGQYVMEPDGYKEVPKSIAEKIISSRAKKD